MGKGKIIIRTQQRFQGKSKYTYYLTFLCLVGSDIAIRNFGYYFSRKKVLLRNK